MAHFFPNASSMPIRKSPEQAYLRLRTDNLDEVELLAPLLSELRTPEICEPLSSQATANEN